MTAQNVEAVLVTIQRLLRDLHDLDIALAALPTTLWQESGLESLALMQVVLHLEEEYDVTVENEQLRDVRAFGDLAHLIVTLTGGSETPGALSAAEQIILRRLWVILGE